VTSGFIVRWTPEAEEDAAIIVDWFDDDINALQVIVQLEERAEALASFPGRGRVVLELR
jgi:plasmid stabilization system protein ParE